MAMLRLLFVAALVALPLWVASTAPANACSCGATTNTELVAEADVIVIATVGETLVLPPESVEYPEQLGDSRIPIETKADVREYIKGSGPPVVLIYHEQSAPGEPMTSCDTFYEMGLEYMFVLRRHDDLRYTAGPCSGSTPTGGGQENVDYIAEVRAEAATQQLGLPDTGTGGSSQPDSSRLPLIAASTLAAVGLAANAAYSLRQRD